MKSILVTSLFFICALGQAQTTADRQQLEALTAQYKAAKAAYLKSHGSGGTKHRFVVSADRLATATMTSEALSPRLRYPEALGFYQEALNLEPQNDEAKNNAAMIDGVYRGMIAKAKAKMGSDPKARSEYLRLTAVYKKIHRRIP